MVDQLNVSECVVFETAVRRYQLWEEIYSSALAEADAGESSAEWIDERRLFLGMPRARSSALVSPLLEQHVASRLAEEPAVLKERRKGREEKQLARGPPAGGADDAGAGADRGRGRGRKRGGR